MTYIKRQIDSVLTDWKDDAYRKPLLIRGARQVGKSSAVRNLAKSFDYYIEINFEMQKSMHLIFEQDLDPHKICEELSLLTNTPIIPGRTLLFLDEIQSCLPAISSLRFFYEKFPELHVVAAGSLLESALKRLASYGVGRIRSLYMYPFSFEEFINASGESGLYEALVNCKVGEPFSEPVHFKFLDYLIRFVIIGGMPEVVATYIRTGSLLDCQVILDDLINSFYDDFAKYKSNVPTSRLKEVFISVVNQTGNKFVYSKASTDANHLQIKESVELLQLAGLIFPITHSSGNGVPLAAEINLKYRKFIILDTGVFQRILGLEISDLILGAKLEQINKGELAEIFVGMELVKKYFKFNAAQLFYWQRESQGSQAEIDFLVQSGRNIVPIEVKSGTRGKMQSLYLFLREKNLQIGVRTSMENIGEVDKIRIFPMYAITRLLKQL
ncbi:MAG TPA: AAA family ATPase [Bacteroidales bacterium]|nr:AAA family ATPase [Bacteroidales bacterium]